MKLKTKCCIYCNKEMESKTIRKSFCSDKCRVYWNRKNPNGNVISPLELETKLKLASKLADKPKMVEIPVKNKIMPPKSLNGIALAIWKLENWK
jgi:hypothetical protein